MNRYHPVLVVLHWLLAIMVTGGLIMGSVVLSETPNSDPEKLNYLRMHMSMGMLILSFTLLRLAIRFKTQKPPHADTGNAVLNKLGVFAHFLLYALVILLGASGVGMSLMAGLPEIVFRASGAPLPVDFGAYPPRAAHGILAKLLLLTVVLHIAAALYHQFARKDGLLSRMWFGKRHKV